jgi:hypothetical protein
MKLCRTEAFYPLGRESRWEDYKTARNVRLEHYSQLFPLGDRLFYAESFMFFFVSQRLGGSFLPYHGVESLFFIKHAFEICALSGENLCFFATGQSAVSLILPSSQGTHLVIISSYDIYP